MTQSEEAQEIQETFNFGAALIIARNGGIVSRMAWNGHGLSMGVVAPPADTGIMPFLAVRKGSGMLMAWVPSQLDMLTDDWKQVHQEGVGHE